MAGKTNPDASSIDKTTYFWIGLCGICHPGGGPGEYDRDNELLWDEKSQMFGYEKLGKTAGDVTLDGDYSVLNSTGDPVAARWDKTGLAESDCMMCHRQTRTINSGKNMNWIWRAASLRAKDKLVDDQGNPVKAFAAASAAGQGWFSHFEMATVPAGKPPLANAITLDYSKGLADGSLYADADNRLYVSGFEVEGRPKDYACWGCHLKPEMKKRGRQWFDPDQDVHYAALNKLNDGDASNDIGPNDSSACTICHPADISHNMAKGNATLGTVHNDLDYQNFLTCRGCHDPNNPFQGAPPTPFNVNHSPDHLRVMSCEMCHIPYKTGQADFVVDNSTTGSTMGYSASAFYSADPLDPDNADKSRWYPSFVRKKDQDGQYRLYPVKLLMSAWWGDWDTKGTATKSDDVIRPIPLWRIRAVTGGNPLTGVTDDNGDGKPEVNRLAEIKIYIDAFKSTTDKHGKVIAANPVLVRGGSVWHEDGSAPEGVGHFEYHGSGIKTESAHPFSVNHNVRDPQVALGSVGCQECHKDFTGVTTTPVFDRLVLVDPWGPDGLPVYKTVRELTGVNPR